MVRAGSPFANALDANLGSLDQRDRRLAHEIAAGVLRRRASLDSSLKPLVSAEWRRVDADLKDILRIGAYQLSHLDRVPKHAAVETSVALARAKVGARAAGMVNAVLRRLAATTSKTGNWQDGSHPEWLVKRWRKRFGASRTAALLAHNDRRPALVIQPVRWSLDQVAGALQERGIAFEPAGGGAGLALRASRVADLPGFGDGAFVVQDPAQARVIAFAAIPTGASIWDACAAPGGKAVTLAVDHRLFASDARRDRLRTLRDTVARVAPRVPVFLADARQPPLRAGSLDAVLLDAPCSATGTFARHPDARWRLTPRRIATLAKLQGTLLDGVAPLVRPGGLLVYATCSLEPEENEDQVNLFLERHPEYGRTVDDLFVFPGEAGTDGAYACRLLRAVAA